MHVVKQHTRHVSPQLLRCSIAILAAICILSTAQAQTLPGWDLVWSDEFPQADGSPPDPHKWGYDMGGWGWGNGELQYYTDRTKNVRIEAGHLVIEAHEESFGGNSYTSARLLTQGRRFANWAYGRMEARIKIPRGQGIWPAFWMLGTDFDTVGWPDCGEIDIMENIGREPGTVHGTVHGPFSFGGHWYSGGSYSNAIDLADEFHVYAVEWETDAIHWYIDDIHYFTATPDNISGGVWVFDHPHFFLLNVAVGGQWPGFPDETTVFPQRMLVDYVRVYTPVPGEPDADGDGIDDASDPCPFDPLNDADGDGFCGDVDLCPNSDLRATVTIGNCDSGVLNGAVGGGCTLADLVNEEVGSCAAAAYNHGKFVRCVARALWDYKSSRTITGKEYRALVRCAARADRP